MSIHSERAASTLTGRTTGPGVRFTSSRAFSSGAVLGPLTPSTSGVTRSSRQSVSPLAFATRRWLTPTR